jgi:hypothetical protein
MQSKRRQASPRVLAAGAILLVLILVAAIVGFTFGRGTLERVTLSSPSDAHSVGVAVGRALH